MSDIPKDHPRYHSLITREKIVEGIKKGIVHETGLIAHGRGEAFDYILGEKTTQYADEAEMTAAAILLCAENPVISVNGNCAILAGDELISLSKVIPAKLEVNLFHRTNERVERVIQYLMAKGADKIYGLKHDASIPDLSSDRALCDKEGIYSADVVLVSLEDGDRCEALKKMGKTVIAVDLNPLSRTARSADVTIVDNVTRAIPNIEQWVKKLKDKDKEELKRIVIKDYNNKKNLSETMNYISKRLNSLF
ncbi:MAG: 4-phosphopantoate--beta-alanine ligase [Candidatus Thermoplasmatota archaeon]